MTTVRKGIDDMHALQDYVDAQAGGPGKGFFQIVTDPFSARRVINAGKMAVVLEIEVSELFGCSGWDHPTCDQSQVDNELDEFYDRGVRSSLFLNKFDNPLAGVRFDSGAIACSSTAATSSARARSGARRPAPGPRPTTRSSPARRPTPPSTGCWARPAWPRARSRRIRPRRTATPADSPTSAPTWPSG